VTQSQNEGQTSKARRTIPHLVVYAVAVSAIFALRYFQVFVGAAVFSSPVHLRYLAPTVGFFKESVLAGRSPAWNPYCYLGMPMLPGCFPGTYYPGNVFFLVPNYDAGCALFLLAHQVMGFFGVYFAASRCRLGTVARLVSSFVYVLTTIVLVGDANLGLAATFAWLPFCFYGLLRCMPFDKQTSGVKPHRAGLVVVNSTFIALLFLSGAIVLSMVALIVFLLMLSIQAYRQRQTDQRTLYPGSYLFSILVAFCLASPVLLPTFDWLKDDSPVNATKNLLRTLPNTVSIQSLLGPQTIESMAAAELARKRKELLSAVSKFIWHQGRYLVLLPKDGIAKQDDSPLCRSIVANVNMANQIESPLGYLGHPSSAYRKFVNQALGEEPDQGFLTVPVDRNGREKLLQFCRFTSTAALISPSWPDSGHSKAGLAEWRSFVAPMKDQAPSWHLLQQTVILPSAYSIDNWHWVKDRKEIIDSYFVDNKNFDPRFNLLVEECETLEIDEERLDKMPFSQLHPPLGPPLTDAKEVPIHPNMTRSKPVDILVYETEHISLSVNVVRPSFIVLRDTFYPGWKAYVDSTPAPCYRANGIARAVFVPQGSHLVVFDYRPDSLKLGINLAISALVLNALLAFFWLSRLLGKTIRYMSVGKFE
jgi:hypothetical protein